MDIEWLLFVLGLIAWPFIKIILVAINRAIIERRRRRFIHLVNVRFRDRKDVTLISVDSSDKRGMQNMERELREKYGIEVNDEDHR